MRLKYQKKLPTLVPWNTKLLHRKTGLVVTVGDFLSKHIEHSEVQLFVDEPTGALHADNTPVVVRKPAGTRSRTHVGYFSPTPKDPADSVVMDFPTMDGARHYRLQTLHRHFRPVPGLFVN